MDPLTTPWWASLGVASVGLGISQLGPFGVVAALILVGSLILSPVAVTVEWFGGAVALQPLKAVAAITAITALPFVASFAAGASGEAEDHHEDSVREALSVAVMAVGALLLSSVVPEAATLLLVAAILIPFMRLGTASGQAIRSDGRGVDPVQAATAFAVLFVVLVVSVGKSQIGSLKFSGGQSYVSEFAGNSLPYLP